MSNSGPATVELAAQEHTGQPRGHQRSSNIVSGTAAVTGADTPVMPMAKTSASAGCTVVLPSLSRDRTAVMSPVRSSTCSPDTSLPPWMLPPAASIRLTCAGKRVTAIPCHSS